MKKLLFFLLNIFFVFQINSQTVLGTVFQDAVGTGDWSIGGTGEHLEIREPEQNKLWARFVDDQRLELIGTPNLVANGNISAAINKRISVGSTSSNYLGLHAATCCPGGYIEYSGGPLIFRKNGTHTAPILIQEDGTVAIGVSVPYDGQNISTNGHKFSVNGGIYCEEVEVINNVPNSDYVFEADYPLLPLEDVEAFITSNKHLPEVPSAEEFKKGYKLGTMDDLLLRKVEELTLYVIELNKENKKLKEAVEEIPVQKQNFVELLPDVSDISTNEKVADLSEKVEMLLLSMADANKKLAALKKENEDLREELEKSKK